MTSKSVDLDDVIDDLGFGKFQWWFVSTVGGFQFFCGAFMQLMGLVGESVVDELGVPDEYRGYLASITFVGLSLGCICSSLGDYCGRLRTFMLGGWIMVGAWLLTGQVKTFWLHLALRMIAGFGDGLIIPSCNALTSEVNPSTSRVFGNVGHNVPFCLGMMYALVLCHIQDPYMQRIDWRALVVLTALPGMLCLVGVALLMRESPRYYALHGRRVDAQASLEYMALANGREPPADTWVCDEPQGESFTAVIFGRLALTTMCFCFSTITLNYIYYGSLYAMPFVLADRATHGEPTVLLFIGAIVELLGYVAADYLGPRYNRRSLVMVYLIGATFFTGVFLFCMMSLPGRDEPFEDRHHVPAHGLAVAMYMFRAMMSLGWLFVYLYVTEIYPTLCRASGCSITFAVGRIGSIIAPLIVEQSVSVYYIVVLILCSLNAACVYWLLPIETKDRQLGSIAREQQSLIPKGRAKNP